MLDLETLGTRPGAVITSIGAVRFNSSGVFTKFYARINPESCTEIGMTIDASTVQWWLGQSDAARKELCSKECLSIGDALDQFSFWYGSDLTIPVWGNGTTFDNALLREAYYRMKRVCPWLYQAERCYRTVKSLRPDIKINRLGTGHHALDDAESQALHLIEIAKSLGI